MISSPQRVVWSEGLFLTPQHLQQQDAYHEALLALRLGALTPYSWGVVELEIDTEALARGQLQLQKFVGILPDGLPVVFERGHAEAPAARAVDDHLRPGHGVLEVFVAVPREREGVNSYGQLRPGEPSTGVSRFEIQNRPVGDLSASGNVVSVGFARRNVRLLFGSEPREDFETIKIAELVRDGSGAAAVNETYVPPCLRISAAPSVISGVRKLLRLMQGKQRELSESRRHRDAASLEFTASDVTRYLQLNSLNGLIPVLNHIVDAGDLPPLQVYLQLVQAVGQLFTFGADGNPSDLPRFQYTNLRATFGDLLAQATMLLRGVALEQCISVPLEPRQGGMHVGKLEDGRLDRCAQFILTVRSHLSEQQIADQFPRLSKIASAAEIHSLVQAAAPGVPLAVTFRPPPEIPVKPGVVYFSIATQDLYWKNAVREKSVAIYLPQALDPAKTQLELLGVPTTSASL